MRAVWIGGAVVLGVLALLTFGGAFSSGLPVEAAAAKIGDIRETIEERGKTRLPRVYSISMPFNGRIEEIALEEGTKVKKDQEVARVARSDVQLSLDAATAAVARLDASIKENDDTSVENVSLKQSYKFVESMDQTVKAARERVRAGQAKLEYATKNHDRIYQLWRNSRGAKTDDDYEQVKLALVQADVDLQQDQLVLRAMEAMQAATALMPTALVEYIGRKQLTHQVLARQKEEAKVNWQLSKRDEERGRMTSPVDGVVLERLVVDERQVTAGTVLLKIGNLNELEVEVDILSQEASQVKPGQPCEIFGPALGDDTLFGSVKSIYPAGFTKVSSLGVEQQRVKVILAFDDTARRRLIEQRQSQGQGLGVDYRVRARIITRQGKGLVVPRSALFRSADGQWSVFAIRDGKARLQGVEVGLSNDEQVEITNGLQAEELVVLAPETNLTDGAKLSPVLRSARPGPAPVGMGD